MTFKYRIFSRASRIFFLGYLKMLSDEDKDLNPRGASTQDEDHGDNDQFFGDLSSKEQLLSNYAKADPLTNKISKLHPSPQAYEPKLPSLISPEAAFFFKGKRNLQADLQKFIEQQLVKETSGVQGSEIQKKAEQMTRLVNNLAGGSKKITVFANEKTCSADETILGSSESDLIVLSTEHASSSPSKKRIKKEQSKVDLLGDEFSPKQSDSGLLEANANKLMEKFKEKVGDVPMIPNLVATTCNFTTTQYQTQNRAVIFNRRSDTELNIRLYLGKFVQRFEPAHEHVTTNYTVSLKDTFGAIREALAHAIRTRHKPNSRMTQNNSRGIVEIRDTGVGPGTAFNMTQFSYNMSRLTGDQIALLYRGGKIIATILTPESMHIHPGDTIDAFDPDAWISYTKHKEEQESIHFELAQAEIEKQKHSQYIKKGKSQEKDTVVNLVSSDSDNELKLCESEGSGEDVKDEMDKKFICEDQDGHDKVIFNDLLETKWIVKVSCGQRITEELQINPFITTVSTLIQSVMERLRTKRQLAENVRPSLVWDGIALNPGTVIKEIQDFEDGDMLELHVIPGDK